MKKPFVALLLLVGAAAMVASSAFAQDAGDIGNKLVNAKQVREMLSSRAQRVRTSSTSVRPDSVWLGHSYTNHWSNTNNFWNLYTGNNFPGTGDPNNAIWDWDHFTGYGPGSPANLGDSLEGWWPIKRFYYITGGLTLADASRPWWALDYGNGINYRINAGAGGQRTKGVIGAWHHDPGNSLGVTWSPIAGARSAWCGLRQHGDNTVVDQVTKNAYNAAAAEFVASFQGTPAAATATGTLKNFPGYMNAWDQMLYRDITITSGNAVNLSFQYRTRMSTQRDAAAATCTGIFYGDPLSVTTGNFISATTAGPGTGGNAPIDSFMVFIGVPTNTAAVTYSDGVVRPVFDPLRRWFSEVIKVFGSGNTYYELFAATGATDTTLAAPTVNATVSTTQVAALLAAQGGGASGTARLVFRVKTNKDYADDDASALGFTSRGWGAAQIDNVIVNGVTIGSFDGTETGGVAGTPNADAPIDNTTSTSAAQNWKATGKPTAIYFHPRNIAQLRYEDLCGPYDSPNRFCNINGTVISAGNRDDNEGAGDRRFFPDRERLDGMMSPTIDLVTDASGDGETPNPMGVTWVDSQAWNIADDYYIWYDLYAGIFNLNFTGNAWTFGAQAYPATQANGGKCWGELRTPTFQIFNPEPQCFSDVEGLYQNGLVRTANADGVPDSLRIFLGKNQQCFRFGVSTTCGANDGAYFDNVSFLFSNFFAGGGGSNLSVDIWQWFNDTFPANETLGLSGTANFDTTSAWIKTGINNAPGVTNEQRFDVAGDTTLVFSPITGSRRIDLVFRILPGPGNYQIAAGRTFPPVSTMQLLKLPTDQTQVSVAGDNSFWGQYMADPGTFGTAGGHHGGVWWDNLTWNSARCDTAERNNFPTSGFATGRGGANLNQWASMYHEADPKFATLGITKFRCFRMDTSVTASNLNIKCDGTVPAWLTTVPASRTGWDGLMTTKEFTKIIPDGLLTPGSHVQYFYRYSNIATPGTFAIVPDTAAIWPQASEGSTDAHRWQQFGVLPDRWKDASFGGQGMACMLYVDNNDRRGNERVFVSVMDSIGGTASAKYGAHNGWHAAGTDDITDPLVVPSVSTQRNSQPGTIWDMYGVKAAESLTTGAGSLGSRLSLRTAGTLLDGKWSRSGPTPQMLRTYYRMISFLSGDLNSGILGPIINRSQDEVTLLNDYLTAAGGTAQPRGLYIGGDGFVYSETQTGNTFPAHLQFLTDKLGLELRNNNYTSVSGNLASCIDLITTATTNPRGDVYAIGNTCLWSNDVLQRSTSAAGGDAVEANFYENAGGVGPYAASVYHQPISPRVWTTLTDGWDIEHIYGRYCSSDAGRLAYYYNMFTTAFAGLNCNLTAGPLVDVPSNPVGRYVNFLKPTINNPLRSGFARVNFSLANRDHVMARVFDVSGRLVRTLADRDFEAGEHNLTWDGSDDSGKQVPRGVYFTQVHYRNSKFTSANKLAVLK